MGNACAALLVEDSVTVAEGTSTEINPLVNDILPCPVDFLYVTAPPGHGTLNVFGPFPSIGYTPHAGYIGEDSFWYNVTFDISRCRTPAEQIVRINVVSGDAPPSPADDTYLAVGDTPLDASSDIGVTISVPTR
jgi:hypothetical protein